MKLAVVGSRSFEDQQMLNTVLDGFNFDLLISGGAKGADLMGENYAIQNGIETLIFKPDWERYGRSAGFIRNKDIISNCDTVVAFWDGQSKGTLSSINLAKQMKKELIIINPQNNVLTFLLD